MNHLLMFNVTVAALVAVAEHYLSDHFDPPTTHPVLSNRTKHRQDTKTQESKVSGKCAWSNKLHYDHRDTTDTSQKNKEASSDGGVHDGARQNKQLRHAGKAYGIVEQAILALFLEDEQ